jgi:hypothetical protein
MKRWHLLFAIVFIASFCAVVRLDAATIAVSIDNEAPVVAPVHFADGEWRIGTPGNERFVHQTAQGKIELVGALDPDPSIFFNGTVTDFGAASSFSFSFVLPLAPVVNNPSFVSDSFAGSVTNVAGSGVTVTALAPPPGIPVDGDRFTEVEVFTLSDDGGVTWQNVGLDLMPTTAVPLGLGGSGVIGPFAEGPIATIPGGPWTHMRADVNFGLTGGGDIFSFSGAKTLVPEPGTLGLLLLALATCCMGRNR